MRCARICARSRHPACGRQPRGQRHQAAGQRAADGACGEAGAIDRGVEDRRRADAQRQSAPTYRDAARSLELAAVEVGRSHRTVRRVEVVVGVKQQLAELRCVAVEWLEVESVVGNRLPPACAPRVPCRPHIACAKRR